MPATFEYLDQIWKSKWMSFAKQAIPQAPSVYWRRQCFVGASSGLDGAARLRNQVRRGTRDMEQSEHPLSGHLVGERCALGFCVVGLGHGLLPARRSLPSIAAGLPRLGYDLRRAKSVRGCTPARDGEARRDAREGVVLDYAAREARLEQARRRAQA